MSVCLWLTKVIISVFKGFCCFSCFQTLSVFSDLPLLYSRDFAVSPVYTHFGKQFLILNPFLNQLTNWKTDSPEHPLKLQIIRLVWFEEEWYQFGQKWGQAMGWLNKTDHPLYPVIARDWQAGYRVSSSQLWIRVPGKGRRPPMMDLNSLQLLTAISSSRKVSLITNTSLSTFISRTRRYSSHTSIQPT